MFQTLDKLMMAGLGAMSMTREKAETLFDEYVQRGQAERSGKSNFVKEVMDSAEKTRKEVETIVQEQTKKAIDTMQLASKDDLQRIETKLDALLELMQAQATQG
jgi:polyhydroxyalkanoate synthesis regulator phasin